MNVIVFGSTGGTGRALVEQALAQGHVVTAFARNPAKVTMTHENLRVAKGDMMDSESVKAALRGQDAALSALGAPPPIGMFVVFTIMCQLIARFAGLSGPLMWLVRLGLPVV